VKDRLYIIEWWLTTRFGHEWTGEHIKFDWKNYFFLLCL